MVVGITSVFYWVSVDLVLVGQVPVKKEKDKKSCIIKKLRLYLQLNNV